MNKSYTKRAGRIALYVFTAVLCLTMAVPFLWMMVSAFKTQNEVLSWPPTVIPSSLQWQNFAEAYTTIDMTLLFKNTLTLVISSMVLQTFSSVMVAYGFARYRAPGSKALFYILLSTMMLPWVVTMVPAYVIFMKLGWLGTLLPLIVPQIGGSAFNIFMIRQFLMTLPKELDEAATIDGCSDFGILVRIILPLCKPILTTVLVFTFISTWSDYLGPNIYITNPQKYTLSLGLQTFRGFNTSMPWHLVMAASLLFALPMVIVFFAAQRAFTKGIVMTGLKD